MTESAERILVMGIGNPLMGDEGVAIRVVELLMSGYEFPENVEVVDAGTMGYTILNLLRDRDFVLVVDAIDGTGYEPGTVVTLSAEDLAPNQLMHSLHDTRLVNVLEAAELSGITPDALCVGIQIQEITPWVTELNEPVEAALPTAVDAVLTILGEHGVTTTPRTSVADDARVLESIRTRGPAQVD